MCQCLNVSRSAYYAWCHAPCSLRTQSNQVVSEKIKMIFNNSRKSYGTRRLKQALSKEGVTVSRRRIGHLMAAMGLWCKTKRKFKVTTDANHHFPITENILNREFTVKRPNQCYVGDITYIATQTGWMYLAVVIDLFSRSVVGWSMAEHMRADLVNDALLMAIWRRKPPRGLLWHTDRGSQYASDSHQQVLAQHGIKHSMSRKGNCWDNAVSESFFHTLKTELVHHVKFKDKEEAKQSIFEYIEVFYNWQRMHSTNGYLSPLEFEQAHNVA